MGAYSGEPESIVPDSDASSAVSMASASAPVCCSGGKRASAMVLGNQNESKGGAGNDEEEGNDEGKEETTKASTRTMAVHAASLRLSRCVSRTGVRGVLARRLRLLGMARGGVGVRMRVGGHGVVGGARCDRG